MARNPRTGLVRDPRRRPRASWTEVFEYFEQKAFAQLGFGPELRVAELDKLASLMLTPAVLCRERARKYGWMSARVSAIKAWHRLRLSGAQNAMSLGVMNHGATRQYLSNPIPTLVPPYM